MMRHDRLEHELLEAMPDAAARNPALVRLAVSEAKPIFAAHCAVCHGSDMRGNPAIGAPNLTDQIWLYGNGSVYDTERTILYGVRAGVSHSPNVTYMPAFGLEGTFRYQGTHGFEGEVVGGPALTSGQVWDLVQYLLKINHRPYQAEAAQIGEALTRQTEVSCRDCHAPDLEGIAEYGAPNLTINVWNDGGTPEDLYRSIYFGSRHMMPAWRGVLTLEQIRALAVYVYSLSHPKQPAQAASGAGPARHAGGE